VAQADKASPAWHARQPHQGQYSRETSEIWVIRRGMQMISSVEGEAPRSEPLAPDTSYGDSTPGFPDQDRTEGSGFFVTSSGYIITNTLVDRGSEVDVITSDGKSLPAKVMGTDAPTDVALLKVEGSDPMEAGAANALVGAYLNKLGLRDSAIIYITSAAPTSITWLTADDAIAVAIKAVFESSDILPPENSQQETASASRPKPASQSGGPIPLSENEMMANLYRGYPASIETGGYKPCLQGGCSIFLRKSESWNGGDGKSRQAVVGVVEIDNGSHGFFRSDVGWRCLY
jgi:hypothetical protein